jgi:hypothetical protein
MEIIYQDEMFTVTNPSMNYLESKINNYPDNLKKVDPFAGEIYHTTIEEFYAYRDKFNAELIIYAENEEDSIKIRSGITHIPMWEKVQDINP